MALDSDRIQNNVRKVGKALKKTHKHSNPDEIHKLRTRIVRLESTLEALALDSKPNERRLLKRLRRIRKRAGAVRDLDVITADLAALRVKGEKECLVEMFEYLGAKRYRRAARLARLVKRTSATVRRRLKKTTRRIEKGLGNGDRAADQDKAVANAATSAIGLTTELAKPTNLNRGNLHAYRRTVKDLRYVLQMSPEARSQSFAESLGEVKDAIGDWHDWEELIAIAEKTLDHGPNCKLMSELKAISSQKFEYALAITNKMRKLHLEAAERDSKRHGRGQGGAPKPALKAVSGVAA